MSELFAVAEKLKAELIARGIAPDGLDIGSLAAIREAVETKIARMRDMDEFSLSAPLANPSGDQDPQNESSPAS